MQLYTGERRYVGALKDLYSVHGWQPNSPPPMTLVVFNAHLITALHLSNPLGSESDPQAEDLNAAITHARLPALTTLLITINIVDPACFRTFLERHPTVTASVYLGRNGKTNLRPLLDPPLPHPGLQRIRTSAEG
ncbi:hypothetical protein C8R47DRAFT_1323612 [Mycena vitilis]|nr:hypothetical protein C8R47DRAFT_1323612 [Mycena vitilis]